ncbi:hypothetical protein AVEN_129798-1 [Araneus ventricosus]|uniref:Uncharacterized protein n=1 Tax=Araneus ventricosus TaxID=182803 RepID=A0A4Y2FPE6_ARAVE|nr:hypothetical protein AVEN_129798-1 [Araneus ventricosus]
MLEIVKKGLIVYMNNSLSQIILLALTTLQNRPLLRASQVWSLTRRYGLLSAMGNSPATPLLMCCHRKRDVKSNLIQTTAYHPFTRNGPRQGIYDDEQNVQMTFT